MSIGYENNAEISHILGIDFGASKIGLAMADSETKMAFAHKTLENKGGLAKELADIIARENVSAVVIGIPSYVEAGATEKEARKLGELLKKNLKVAVFYHNEMFTTKMAQDNLKEKGAKNIHQLDDEEAARIILQEWLDIDRK